MPRAITKAHRRIGVMACLVCSTEIPVRTTADGKISCPCTWCGAPIYINQGTEAHELIMKRVRLDPAPGAAATDKTGEASSSGDRSSPEKASEASPPAAPPKPAMPPARSWSSPLFGAKS